MLKNLNRDHHIKIPLAEWKLMRISDYIDTLTTLNVRTAHRRRCRQ